MASILVIALPAASATLTPTSVSLQISSSSVGLHDPVTLTAFVNVVNAPPPTSGTVSFWSVNTNGTKTQIGSAGVTVSGSTTSVATFTTDAFATGSYQIVARYNGLLGKFSASDFSAPVSLTVGNAELHNTTTTLTADHTTIIAGPGNTVTFSAHVSSNDSGAPVPTGTVTFEAKASGSSLVFIGQGDLDADGNTTLAVGGWIAGTYTIIAGYEGDRFDSTSSAQLTLQVNPGVTQAVDTTTDVSVDPTLVVAGGTVTMSATVTQSRTGAVPLAGDQVTFYATADGSGPVLLDQADVTWTGGGDTPAVGTATLTISGRWLEGHYSIEADFVGDIYDNASSGKVDLNVYEPVPTNTTYTGPTSGKTGVNATLAGVLEDSSGNPLSGQTLTLQLAGNPAESCTGTTDDAGFTSCPVLVSETPGEYPVTASFGGSGHYLPSSGPGRFTVQANNVAVTIPTTLTYTGDTAGTAGGVQTLSFELLDPDGIALANQSVTITVEGQSFPLITDGDGVASIQVSEAAGTHSITASFGGDGTYLPSVGSGSLTVSKIPTSLGYTGDTSASAGAPATISFVLRDAAGNAVLADRPVTLHVDSHDYPATTDANGVASVQITAPASGGDYPVTASYDGDDIYLGSDGAGTLTVTRIPTTLTYTGDTIGSAGSPATVSFALRDADSNALLANEQITITIDGHDFSAATDANGVASIQVTKPIGTYPITAAFGGDATYLSSAGTGQLVVQTIPTTTTYTGDTQTTVGAHATLSAKLVDKDGSPLAGRTVTISFGSSTCDAVTGANGVATCTVTVVDVPGSYAVTASFAGAGVYLASSGPGTIVVGKATTTIVDNVTGNFLLGSSLTLSGTLSANGAPLAGKSLTLRFGTASCTTGPTNASGTATCSIAVPGPTGQTTTTASFAGDASYTSATDSKPALVYATAPGGGSFVVGDLTATGNVYFWGSQWWKQNSLSAGDAQAVDPAAFKGFAANPTTPQCGTAWSTNPGNSNPPPDGPLPAYMAVIVTSQNHKAPGKTITGNTVSIVIVKTNAGYDDNPGHPGTGSVVATLCTSDGGSSGGSGGTSGGGVTPPLLDCSAKKSKCESLLANPSVPSGSIVGAGQTLSILYTDDAPMATTPSVIMNGQSLPVTVTPTSGKIPVYVDANGGSKSTKVQATISFTVPSDLAPGTYTIVVTVQDGDGDSDQWSWSVTIA